MKSDLASFRLTINNNNNIDLNYTESGAVSIAILGELPKLTLYKLSHTLTHAHTHTQLNKYMSEKIKINNRVNYAVSFLRTVLSPWECSSILFQLTH